MDFDPSTAQPVEAPPKKRFDPATAKTADNYETKLSPAEEKGFQDWKRRYAPNDSGADYDLRGAFKAGVRPDADRGHFPDTFKKPNHPTFSVESQYSKGGTLGGRWSEKDGKTIYEPSPWNLKQNPPDKLRAYFQASEPTAALVLPQEPSAARRFDPATAKPAPAAASEPETKRSLLQRLFKAASSDEPRGDTIDPRPAATRKSVFANMKDEGIIDSPRAPARVLANPKSTMQEKLEATVGYGAPDLAPEGGLVKSLFGGKGAAAALDQAAGAKASDAASAKEIPAPGRLASRESGVPGAERQAVPGPPPPSQVGSTGPSNIVREGPLSKPPGLTEPRTLEDQLFQLHQLGQADKLEVIQRLKDLPENLPPETMEKLYHFEESPRTVQLSAEEQALYDKHVKPIAAEADRLSVELERMGYPVDKVETGARAKKIEKTQAELETTPKGERLPSSEGYTPRYPVGKTRSFGEVLHQWKKGIEAKFGGAPGRSMRKTADSQNSRRYYLAADSAGNKQVVYVAPGGDVIPFSVDTKTGKSVLEKDLGAIGKVNGRLGPGAKFKVGDEEVTLENATTKQIEDVATTRYHKNVLANRFDNLTKLRSAVRNAKFIEAMKASPDWDKVAMKVDDAAEPPRVEGGREWRVPKGPLQFRGYYMEPRVADALEDFAAGNRNLEGTVEGLDKAANIVKGSIFWWPLPHMLNTFDHYIVAGGLLGNVKGIGSAAVRAFKGEARDIPIVKAIRAVATQNEDYMQALKAGASLPYAGIMTRDLHKVLIARLGESVKAEPKRWENISKAFGYVNPIAMIKGIYGASSTALWASTDAMNLAKIFAEQQGGKSLEQAISSAEQHMPNYRIPGQVAGTRLASQILRNPLFTMFGRYQYNRLASYGHMVNALVSKIPAAEKAETLDKLAMLGFMMFVAYPAIDDGLKKVTNNPDASFRRPGASAVPQAILDVGKGEKSPPEGVSSVFSLGPLFDTVQEAYHGNYGFSGQPVARMSDLERGDKQFLYDLFAWIGSKVQPVGMASSITQGKQTPSQILESLFNVKDPNPNQKRMKEYYKRRDDQAARRRDVREERKRDAVVAP